MALLAVPIISVELVTPLHQYTLYACFGTGSQGKMCISKQARALLNGAILISLPLKTSYLKYTVN